MSGATYRIEVEHKPALESRDKWVATITRVSDGMMMTVLLGSTGEDAARRGRHWVAAQFSAQPGAVLYVDDEGQDADAPHSVKA